MKGSAAALAPLDVEAAAAAAANGVGRQVPDPEAVAPAKPSSPSLAKVIFLASAGNVLEWMDFALFAFFSAEEGPSVGWVGVKPDCIEDD